MAKKLILPNSVPLTSAQQACVDLLEETLEAAQAGMLNGLGIVAGMTNGGFGTAITGTNAAGMNLALDVLKAKVLNAVARDDALSRSN